MQAIICLCCGYYTRPGGLKGPGQGRPCGTDGRTSRLVPALALELAPAGAGGAVEKRDEACRGSRAYAVREALYAPLLAIACTAVPATSAGQRSGLAVQPQALCFASSRRRRKNPWSPPSPMTAPGNSPLPLSHIEVTKPKPQLPVDTSPVMRLGALAVTYLGIPECCDFSSRCSSNTWLL